MLPTDHTMKLISLVDLETTGLDPRTCEIIEMAVIVFDKDTFEIDATYETKVIPRHIETADPKALLINGYRKEDWKDAISLYDAMAHLTLVTAGTQLLAQNVTFDWSFLLEAALKSGMPLTFTRPNLDLPSIAWAKIPHEKVQSWSLRTLCAYLHVRPEDKVHRAMGGASSAFNVYRKLMV